MPRPLPVEEALRRVLQATPLLPFEVVPYRAAAGRVLQEEVRAPHDYPPFEKAMMDGYAVRAEDLDAPPRRLRVIQEIPAGSDPRRLEPVGPGTASRIMTGAPMPPGADSVLMVEQTEAPVGEAGAVIARGRLAKGDNVAHRGEDVRAGEALLAPGELIGPAEIAVLASCGATRIRVGGRPRLTLLATGDELVDPGEAPAPGRIRNSNGPMLEALAARIGCDTADLGIAPDDEAGLREAIGRALTSDVLVLSGGVSVGTYDLVRAVLRSLGAEILFEKVAIKPGRPFTFGRRGSTLIFGCPGNPVSAYVIFNLFARPALRRMMGFLEPEATLRRGVLTTPVSRRPGRTVYCQARAWWTGSGYAVRVLPTSGSADFVSCARGNAMAIVPPGSARLTAGEAIDFLLLEDFQDR
ncbi:MAG: gephyrin-like molybdotransferase Glp [Acidobacteriota bacterium]